MKSLKYIPFTYHWIVRRAIGDDVKTLLDLGCGEGNFTSNLSKNENWLITGVELHTPSYKKAKEKGIYNEVLKGDVLRLPKKIMNKKYDVVFASQVLEHIRKKDGEKALKTWEKLAEKKLVITTPLGFIEYDPIENKEENNPLQKHLSGWDPEELSQEGFVIRGQGAKFVYGKYGLARIFPSILPFWGIIGLLFSPLVYFFPKLGTYIVAVKKMQP